MSIQRITRVVIVEPDYDDQSFERFMDRIKEEIWDSVAPDDGTDQIPPKTLIIQVIE